MVQIKFEHDERVYAVLAVSFGTESGIDYYTAFYCPVPLGGNISDATSIGVVSSEQSSILDGTLEKYTLQRKGDSAWIVLRDYLPFSDTISEAIDGEAEALRNALKSISFSFPGFFQK